MALLADGQRELARTCEVVEAAEAAIRGYLDAIGASAAASTPAAAPLPPLRGSAAPTGPAPVTTAEVIERLRTELPPTVATSTGQKTHGRWFGPDGQVHAEASGRDDKYAAALEFFTREFKARRLPARLSDVEMKLAVHMRRHDIRSATLVINHFPCVGRYGCDELVPVILPEGYSLTVYGPEGFVRTYQGGKTSRWVP